MSKRDILERIECWCDKHWHTWFIAAIAWDAWAFGFKMAEGDWRMAVISAVITAFMAWYFRFLYRNERGVTESRLVGCRNLADTWRNLAYTWRNLYEAADKNARSYRNLMKAERNTNMAVNVTQKDATLREIIDWCDQRHVTPVSNNDMYTSGYNQALENVAAHCRKRLGYSGVMPLEVPNQSEQAHTMTCTLDAAISGCRYQCSCGYWTADKDEATTHIKEES